MNTTQSNTKTERITNQLAMACALAIHAKQTARLGQDTSSADATMRQVTDTAVEMGITEQFWKATAEFMRTMP